MRGQVSSSPFPSRAAVGNEPDLALHGLSLYKRGLIPGVQRSCLTF